ncbi:hypothetical protein [Alkalicoccus chagannorensis]|uniref:hypothetical protein n=1 Tax=Alkalicoccus chagannorensis TaxID=427072 RepID=UPI00040F0422|nr:hypothetical protein [Alkalicoccus chagannorensis]
MKRVLLLPLLLLGCSGYEEEEAFPDAPEETVGMIQEAKEDGALREQTLAYEAPYAAEDYHGAAEDEPYDFKPGSDDVRVLVTAPHAVAHLREEEEKLAEIYTGAAAHLLQHYTDVHVLTATRKATDPSYHADVPFKEKLEEVVETYDIALVLDLHGMDETHDMDIDLGTAHGEHIEDWHPEALAHYAGGFGLEDVYENRTFPAENPETIAAHAASLAGVEAMQIEIHADYRDPRDDIDRFSEMVKSLTAYIETTKNRN